MKRILWFRRDLRAHDTSLLTLEGEVLPIFIFDTNILSSLEKDDKRVSFIFSSVMQLKSDLRLIGLDLQIFFATPLEVFSYLNGFDEVAASGDYDAYAKQRDIEISHLLHFRYLSDTYLFKPQEVLKDDKTPYLVFTPFYKKARVALEQKDISNKEKVEQILLESAYENIIMIQDKNISKLPLEIESINSVMSAHDEKKASQKLQEFKSKLPHYKRDRDFLSLDASSSLAIDLRFGTISLHEILREVKGIEGSEDFIRQLLFRDFYAYLLFHFPDIETKNYKYAFNGIEDNEKYEKFCSAQTGVPIVDAGVRELLQTGMMHNRVRMIVASFFTKDLLLPWQWGERFFAQHLLDYDKASNVLSWQWSAGTGVDPQPYFRIFNPYLQSKKFDADALYIKKYLPELTHIPAKNIHSEEYLLMYKINTYPQPMLFHKEASKIALSSFKENISNTSTK